MILGSGELRMLLALVPGWGQAGGVQAEGEPAMLPERLIHSLIS